MVTDRTFDTYAKKYRELAEKEKAIKAEKDKISAWLINELTDRNEKKYRGIMRVTRTADYISAKKVKSLYPAVFTECDGKTTTSEYIRTC